MIDPATAAYALLLGIVAAFNPCGFALLPAYISVLVTGTADARVPRAVALRRAVTFGLAMTLGFITVFVTFGLLFGLVSRSLQGAILPWLSWVTVGLGVLVVVLGIVVIVHGELRGPGLRFEGRAPRRAFLSQTIYGASFAIASLSCTIGLFIAIVVQAVAATNPVSAVGPFLLYALGMGTSVVLVSILAALLGTGVVAILRRHTLAIMRVGGVIMVLAGLGVVLFGLSEILPRFGIRVLDGVLITTSQWQGAVAQAIQSWGTPVLIALVVIAVASVAAVLWRSRTRV
jgi:cytochrome c biogenesis protein CcdA